MAGGINPHADRGVRLGAMGLFAVSGALLLGALGFQYLGGLPPCEMCFWQRYAHLAVLVVAGAAWLLRSRAVLLGAVLAMGVSAGLGLFHAGVELGWWEGVTTCAAPVFQGMSADEMLGRLMAAPLVRCDTIPWSLWGISMAGWNALVSGAAALAALWMWRKA